ncbi:MAG: hypothetical protein WA633_12990, partial [Stellaceae bacterium]
MRRIFAASVAGIVLVSALLASLPIAAQQAASGNVPAKSDETAYVQKTFIIATFIDPPTGSATFDRAKEAHFNLFTARGHGLSAVGGFSTGEMDSRLDLA